MTGQDGSRQLLRSSGARGFLAWLLIGVIAATAVVVGVLRSLPDRTEPPETPSPPARGPDRYTRLGTPCDYLDTRTARARIPDGRATGGQGPGVGADAEATCTWHRPSEKTGPRREVVVEVALFRRDGDADGTTKAATAFAESRVQAEEEVPPSLLPRAVPELGDEALATPAQFHSGGLQYWVRRGNVILRIVVAARTGDPDTARARREKDGDVHGLAEYALAKLG